MINKLRLLIFAFWAFFTSASAQTFTSPPATLVRTMAEWEELQALVVTWNVGSGGNAWRDILTEIIRAARLETKVIVVCNNQTVVNNARNYLTQKLVDIESNVEFVIATNDSIWVRDYGPNTVYANGVDSLLLVDWIYNRPRYNDNTIPQKLGQHLQLPAYITSVAPYDLVNTGGNFMSDGMGTGFCSKLILRNNDQIANGEGNGGNDIFGSSNHDETSIDNIMVEFMGIQRYIKMQELPYDGIHHIDMHMKLLDEETLLVGEFPANTSDGPQIEANIQYVLSQYKTSFGKDFKLVRIPMPPFENGQYPPYGGDPDLDGLYPTYANAVFVNKTVIMPKYNIALDAAAQDTFEKYLPGYHIAQVDCNAIIYSGGAVHCITKEIGVADPLLIQHSVLACQDNSATPQYDVYSTIRHRSGVAGATVFYTTNLMEPWQSVDMQYVNGDTAFLWHAAIPHQAAGSTVYYYIEAEAENGKTITRPMTAPEGYWSFCVTQSSGLQAPEQVQLNDIFPNPASAITAIPVSCNRAMEAAICLRHSTGALAATIFQGTLPAGKSHHFFNAAMYPSGIYFVEIKTNGQISTQKVVIR